MDLIRFLQSCDRCGAEALTDHLNVLCDHCLTVKLAAHMVDDILLPVSPAARTALIDMFTASLSKFATVDTVCQGCVTNGKEPHHRECPERL